MAEKSVDVVIIGSGIAGLMTAYVLAEHMNVIIITKSNVETSNSSWAQGGMAAAIGAFDHWKYHLLDTIQAGHDHHRLAHLEMVVKRAPEMVQKLQDIGVQFDKDQDGSLLLGMEGAHGQRRIVHANGDQTGKAFTEALIRTLIGRVTILEQTVVTNLLCKNDQVIGVQTKDECIYAGATVLATGGVGQLYAHTSNVVEATGDGFALAYRAGASLVDMEFVQFHPTLFIQGNKNLGLISEAVRGEGACLINEHGKKLMEGHPLGDLAPRDVISRVIQKELDHGRSVYLDCRAVESMPIKFPHLYERCRNMEMDKGEILLPVAPGAHFISGGVETDEYGQTSLTGLYAVGEVACTGVHGANRLASNSLLEGFVFAEQAAKHIQMSIRSIPIHVNKKEVVVHSTMGQLPTKAMIQEQMTTNVGIERDQFKLQKMQRWLEPFLKTAQIVDQSDSRGQMEIKNMLIVATLMTDAALKRTESRGGHYRRDYPAKDESTWSHVYIHHSHLNGLTVKQETNTYNVI